MREQNEFARSDWQVVVAGRAQRGGQGCHGEGRAMLTQYPGTIKFVPGCLGLNVGLISVVAIATG